MVICLERGACDLRTVQLMPLPPIISFFITVQIGLTFLMPAYRGRPRKEAVTFTLASLTVYDDTLVLFHATLNSALSCLKLFAYWTTRL